MAKFLIILVFFSVLAPIIFAQENDIRFDHISSEQGLYQSVIYCILQDSRGFMWFGTQNGLVRYDGYTFKEFKKNPNDSFSLSHNLVRVIYEDISGNLWIGTEGGGLNRFIRDRENFIRYPYKNPADPNPGPDIDVIMTIYEDQNGMFWIGTWGGLLCFDSEMKKWSRFDQQPGVSGTLSNNRIRAFFQDHTGIMWIGTEGGGLNAFDPQTGEISHFLHHSDMPDSLSDNTVFAFCEDSRQDLWVGTLNGLDRFDRKTKTFIHYRHHGEDPGSLSSNNIRVIFEDSKQKLWIGTWGGALNRLKSLAEKTFVRYNHQPNNPHSLNHNTIYCIMEDNTGCLWIGTYGGGINRINPLKQQFSHFGGANRLSNNDVYCFLEDKYGILWIGTLNNGLIWYEPATGRFKFYKYDNRNPQSLSSNQVMALHEDKEGVLWIGTDFGGINCYNRDKETFTHYTHIPGTQKGPGSNSIYCFCEDGDNNLWIGTFDGGLNLYLRESREFKSFKNDPQKPGSISSNGINAIYADRKNKSLLWIGTYNNGLELFNRHTETFTHYPHIPENLNSISENTVHSIYISPDQPEIVWVGTLGGGLNAFDQRTQQWHVYTEEDGLPDNTIVGILEDSNNNLWLSTGRGLSRFNSGKMEFKNYYAEDGLQGNEFNQGAYYKSKNGQLYFGGINGFNTFFPEDIITNTHKPPVVITSFNVSRRNFKLEKSILESREINLSYRDAFSFEFAALDYTSPTKNSYEYKVEGKGLPSDWIELGHKHEIAFPTFPPGKYVFRVRGSNNDGVWNEEGTSIRIIITPPFWQTWWFFVLMFFWVMGMLLVMYKWRIMSYTIQRRRLEIEVVKRTREISEQKDIIQESKNQLEKTKEQLEVWLRELKKSEMKYRELNATKDKFFSIISHDLRNHLTALLGFSDILLKSFDKFDDEKKLKYTRSIDSTTKGLYDIMENLLQWTRNQTGGMQYQPKTFDIAILITEILNSYAINAQKKKIDLFHDSIEKGYSVYADKNMVRAILRNLISNGIKFTETGGEVRVAVSDKNHFIEISVIDTGIGISNSDKDRLFKVGVTPSTKGTAMEKGTGLGLILCKEFVEKNNGRIWIESPVPGGSEKGSAFRFTLPKPAGE